MILNMFNKSMLKNYIDLIGRIVSSSDSMDIGLLFERLSKHFDNDGRVFLAGNGGSAAVASHATADLSKLNIDNKNINAISLNENIPLITALSNDNGYENYLVQIISNYSLTKNDSLIVISSSGNSNNLINLVNYANKEGLETFGLLGFDGGKLGELIKFPIIFSSETGYYGPVEDLHMIIFHLFSHIIKKDIKEIYK